MRLEQQRFTNWGVFSDRLKAKAPTKRNVNEFKEVKKINNLDKGLDTVTFTTTSAAAAAANAVSSGKVEQVKQDIMKVTKSNAPAKAATEDVNKRISDIIPEVLEEAGIELTDEQKDELYVSLIKAHVNKELHLNVNISDVTKLIDLNLKGTVSGLDVTLVTNLIDNLLNSDTSVQTDSATLKEFILNKANELVGVPDIPEPDAPTVNAVTDQLFGSEETITADQIYSNISNINNYNDDSKDILSALSTAAQNMGLKYSIYDDIWSYGGNSNDKKNYQTFINSFIELIYEECGEEVQYSNDYTKSPILSKDIMNKYFQNHTLDELTKLIGSNRLKDTYYMDIINQHGGIDEVVDPFNQSQNSWGGTITGDCYLLSAVLSYSKSEKGLEILNNFMDTEHLREDENGKYYEFNFGGNFYSKTNNKSDTYNYKKEPTTVKLYLSEIVDAINAGNKYATENGPMTMRIIEAAFSKYLQTYLYTSEPTVSNGNGDGYISNGILAFTNFALTGNSNTQWTDDEQSFMTKMLNELEKGNIQEGTIGNYVITIGKKGAGHANAVTSITKDYFTYVDPINMKETKVYWEDFVNGGTQYTVQWANLDTSGSSYWSDWY